MKASSRVIVPVSTKTFFLIKGIAFASLMGLSSIIGVAGAASQCKGLDNNACTAAETCGWVESYQRKDGREVKAFCRTSSKGQPKKVVGAAADKGAAVNRNVIAATKPKAS